MWSIFEMLLEKNGVSIADVSKATGIAQSVFSNWKKRNSRLSARNAEKIANFFGVSVGYLMGVQESAQAEEYFENAETALEAQMMFEDHRLRGLNHIKRSVDPKDFDKYYKTLITLYLAEHPEDNYDFDIGKFTS